jgi:DNA polymerase III subunit delta
VKPTGARAARFLASPDPACRAVLFHGEDQGMVRERAQTLAQAIVPDLTDPFRVAELTGESLRADPVRLDDEARAISLMGGRRVVRVRGAEDGLALLFGRFLAEPPPGDCLVVVEAGALAPKSALRRAFEEAKSGAAIACYADGPGELGALVEAVMAAHRVRLERDARDYVAHHLGPDRLLNRGELEKLALYAGDGGTVSLAEARAVVGDSAEITIDDAVNAAAAGDLASLERSLQRAFDEGEPPVTILRAALRHFQRLYAASARLAQGVSAEDAMARLRPPVFQAMRDNFRAHLRLWPKSRAGAALEALYAAERTAKRTGIPAAAVCRDALLRLARGARRPR